MKRDWNPSFNSNDNKNNKENIHDEYQKVTFNLVEKSTKKDLDKKAKQSMMSSKGISKNFPSKANSFLNINNNESLKKLLIKLSKVNLNIDEVPVTKSSHNIKNNLVMKTLITKTKIAKTKLILYLLK